MSDLKVISPLKLSIGAVTAAVVLNIVIRVLLKFEGVPVTIIIAGLVPLLVLVWLIKVIRQKPTPSETTRFLILYSAILAGLCVAAALLAYANNSLNLGGIIILTVHYLVYPFFARITLSQKQLEHVFKS